MTRLIGKGKFKTGDRAIIYRKDKVDHVEIVDIRIKTSRSMKIREVQYLVELSTYENKPCYWLPERYIYRHNKPMQWWKKLLTKLIKKRK